MNMYTTIKSEIINNLNDQLIATPIDSNELFLFVTASLLGEYDFNRYIMNHLLSL